MKLVGEESRTDGGRIRTVIIGSSPLRDKRSLTQARTWRGYAKNASMRCAYIKDPRYRSPRVCSGSQSFWSATWLLESHIVIVAFLRYCVLLTFAKTNWELNSLELLRVIARFRDT